MSTESMVALVHAHARVTAPPMVPEIPLWLADEITPLWEALEAGAGREVPPPFWAFPWAGGQALARYLLDHPDRVRGRAVLDFGAGSGLVAIAAMRAGASRAVAAEIDPLAEQAIAENAALAGVAVERVTRDIIGDALPGIDVVLVGDMCYEQPLAGRMLAWLDALALGGRTVLIGDPGRTYAPRSGLVELACYDVPTTMELESRTVRTTRVSEMIGS